MQKESTIPLDLIYDSHEEHGWKKRLNPSHHWQLLPKGEIPEEDLEEYKILYTLDRIDGNETWTEIQPYSNVAPNRDKLTWQISTAFVWSLAIEETPPLFTAVRTHIAEETLDKV